MTIKHVFIVVCWQDLRFNFLFLGNGAIDPFFHLGHFGVVVIDAGLSLWRLAGRWSGTVLARNISHPINEDINVCNI